MKQYEKVIGLEVHVELNTNTKIFCGCSTKFGAKPNSQTCPVCMAMPGTLPVLNEKVVKHAVAVGLATNCRISEFSRFDRKNYFYPDNPQNYQISQLYMPICHDGYVEVETDCGMKRIGIHEIHMEEDAGKLIHDDKTGCSLIDFNRAGVPLIEIVSEPDMSSADEVIAYLEKLRLIIKYLGVSDCKLNEGSMRADVNISVREVSCNGEKMPYGTRTEMKNLNSFRAIRHAIENEASRQIEVIENGGHVIMETRRWDEENGKSYPMRSKEDSKDYRYFPDPDLMPLILSKEYINKVAENRPEFREEKIARYVNEYKIPKYDAGILTLNVAMTGIFEETVKLCGLPKKVSNWLLGETMRLIKESETDPEDINVSPKKLSTIIKMCENGSINNTVAKEVFEKVFYENTDPEEYIKTNNLLMESKKEELASIIDTVLSENGKSVDDYRNGKDRAFGFLVGQVMKATKGKANPAVINKLLMEKLKS